MFNFPFITLSARLQRNLHHFNDELSEVDWNRIIANGTNCVNKLFSSFYNKYNTIVNKHTPVKKIYHRKAEQLPNPWITNGNKAAIKVRNKLYATGDKIKCKHYRNKICTLIRVSKRRYYDTFFENSMVNKEATNFYIRGNKTQSHICIKGLLIIVTKLLRKVRGYLTLLMNTLQQSETDLLITYPFPKNII